MGQHGFAKFGSLILTFPYLTLFDQFWTDDKKMKDVTEQVLNRTMLFSFLRNLLYLISAASSPSLFPVTKRESVNTQTGNCLLGRQLPVVL